jgi:predicted NBD/HSP70 family sugar kinase
LTENYFGDIVRLANKLINNSVMRKIDPKDFKVATRTTSRDINRLIALNIIRENQPLSRADLARTMKITRGVAGTLVQELIDQRMIYEGTTGEALRGRKPTFLHIRTHDRHVVAVDVRFSKTYIMLSDFAGQQIALEMFDTIFDIPAFIEDLSARIGRLLRTQNAESSCEGVGIVVPGMVDLRTGKILYAPALGWRDIDIVEKLSEAVGLPVQIENAGRACALAHLWWGKEASAPQNFVYVNVSDGVGIGIIRNGEVVRGHNYIAGEFGHMPLNIDGPQCMCGSRGCWEAYVSNLATLARYFGRDLSKLGTNRQAQPDSFTVLDLIGRARANDPKALAAIDSTARYLGLGLSSIINLIDPDVIYLAGEIITAWDLIEERVREAIAERALTESAAHTRLRISNAEQYPRLRGAAALFAAPTFAAPRVA